MGKGLPFFRPDFLTLTAVLSLAFTAVTASSALQAPAFPCSSQAVPVPPEHPVTLEQLRTMMQLDGTLEGMKERTMEIAEQQRRTLPIWFPQSVWDAVEKKIMTVDIPASQLQVYQRYFSREDADALILYFQGPVGRQIAEHFIHREEDASRSGAVGAATTSQAIAETMNSSDTALAARRMNELSPEDQKRVLAARQVVANCFKRLSDEAAIAYNDTVTKVVQKEINSHSQELAPAQQAFLRKSSPENTANH